VAIVVRGANSTHLYPLGGTYGGHVGYRFGTHWYMVAVEQRHRGDAFDLYYEEPDAMTRERELWAYSLIRWCRY